ncbi:MAG TPA: hypothetical protein VD994_11755, partial [Prosthecobacter sp.]|nr:hypothetical protein [Prosthecobacter sp.]
PDALGAARTWLNDNEADLTSGSWSGLPQSLAALIEAREKAAVEKERERCAYIAESYAPPDDRYPMTAHGACVAVANAIRKGDS